MYVNVHAVEIVFLNYAGTCVCFTCTTNDLVDFVLQVSECTYKEPVFIIQEYIIPLNIAFYFSSVNESRLTICINKQTSISSTTFIVFMIQTRVPNTTYYSYQKVTVINGLFGNHLTPTVEQ